jgi:DNA-directed RNA polymerase subunit beta
MSNVINNRENFASVQNPFPYPDFLDVQLKSFKDFLQLDTPPEERKNDGLYKVFAENFPITDTRNNFVLEFLDYYIDPPRYSISECLERGLTYSVPLKAKMKLYCTDPDHEDFGTFIQDVFLGTIPYMTDNGTFIINGAERVVVSQLHRSPGVFFGQGVHANGTVLYSARIIPFKGSWIEFATDINDVMYAYIDRKKKLPVTTLLRAIGYESDKDILQIFDLAEEIKVNKRNRKELLGRRLAARVLKSWNEDFVDEDTGEVVTVERNDVILEREIDITEDNLDAILESGVSTVLVHKDAESANKYDIIFETLKKDTSNSEREAVNYIYRQLRNAEPADDASAREVFQNLFFSDKRYDLGEVGRYRINKKLGENIDMDVRVLTKEDIIEIIKYLIKLIHSNAMVDDIDHLSNRRVRTVGEQLANQFSIGLARMSRTIRERMNVRDNEVFTPTDLINAKTISSVINSFFGTNPLSQFMDQTNPLAEVTHKRRLSALGPGGLSRERAGFEVRDVHYTHYGRLCPIESPEGPNIGLISSLCVYATINELGFIETPYRKVDKHQVDLNNDDVVYLTAEEEEGRLIAQGNAPLREDGTFIRSFVHCRYAADFPVVDPDDVNLMDVSPQQIASVSASLIPFLEHDDGHRALMGCNMMRQAVPLLHNDAPIVGTGLEKQVCEDSRTMITAEGEGVIEYVDATTIRILYDRTEDDEFVSFEPAIKEYSISKFRRTNQNMTIDLRPICSKGQRVKKGDILTEGYATENGELALGRNLLVAYMPWKGYNYEDAVVISERMVREDVLTSVHVDEYSLDVRETKRGMEVFTSDIPNVSEEATKDLDDNGVIRIGARVEPGDIMIGKISPKGESDPSPEEKLLRAIFGDKAGDVKDSSLKANPSLSGVVIDKKLFARAEKTRESKKQDKILLQKIDEEYEAKSDELKNMLVDKLMILTEDKTCQGVKDYTDAEIITRGSKFTVAALKNLEYDGIQSNGWTEDEHTNGLIQKLIMNYIRKDKQLAADQNRRKFAITIGDDLPSGVLKMAKVYIAKKRKIQVGDKLAGRHGNKGIVSKIVRMEDMPFLEDGRPVDLVLNPMGVPSRMNLGQIFEAILGAAGRKLGKKFATPIFDGAKLDDLKAWTDKAGLPNLCSTYIYDGETGERFDQPATVGVTYFMKLGHMVEDKMHARSIGPYSLITQQPLGGKAQFGGQRFGEMEVWALEGFGASHVLQEMLTIKSDDVTGRSKAYESIVKGDPMPTPGIPESLNVLLHELRGLGLSVKLD